VSSWLLTRLTIKSFLHRPIRNKDDGDEQHTILTVAKAAIVDYRVITTKITTIVQQITTKIMIAQRIPNFWGMLKKPMHSGKWKGRQTTLRSGTSTSCC